jgi:hypothetical protein
MGFGMVFSHGSSSKRLCSWWIYPYFTKQREDHWKINAYYLVWHCFIQINGGFGKMVIKWGDDVQNHYMLGLSVSKVGLFAQKHASLWWLLLMVQSAFVEWNRRHAGCCFPCWDEHIGLQACSKQQLVRMGVFLVNMERALNINKTLGMECI